MQLIRSFLGVILLFCLSLSLNAQNTLPDINLKTLEGETVNLAQLATENELTVVSFWATWCAPCIKELDAIAEIYGDWQDDYGVELIAITVDDARTLSRVSGIVKSKDWPYTILSDVNGEVWRAMSFQTPPQTYLVNRQGQVIYDHSGYSPGAEIELEDKIIEAASKGK